MGTVVKGLSATELVGIFRRVWEKYGSVAIVCPFRSWYTLSASGVSILRSSILKSTMMILYIYGNSMLVYTFVATQVPAVVHSALSWFN